jgi:hypothetical protein
MQRQTDTRVADRIDTLGWGQDPTGTHQLRYHDGTAYTQYVFDDGVVGVDLSPVAPRPYLATPIVGEVLPPVCVLPDPAVASPNPPDPPTAAPVPAWGPPPGGDGPPPWGSGDPQVAPPARKIRRLGLWVAVAAAAVEAIAIAVLGLVLVGSHSSPVNHSTTAKPIGSTVVPSGSFGEYAGPVVFSSNFAANDGWDTGSLNSNTTATVLNGQYVVKGWTDVHHPLLAPYATPQRGISVETSATGYPAGNVSIGTGCQSAGGISPALVYQMVVYPDGQWYIEEGRIPGRVEALLSGKTSPLGITASTQLTCVITTTNADAQTTQLVGYVNGVQVGAVGDQIEGVNVDGYVPILELGSFGPRVSAAFTHVIVRSLSAPEQPQLQIRLWPRGSLDVGRH